MIAGVLAGMAEYFDHDPVLWRIGFVILLIATGLMPGVLVYFIAWIVIPLRPEFSYRDVTPEPDPKTETNDNKGTEV